MSIRIAFTTLALWALAGCAHQQPVPEPPALARLAPAYAQYQTEYRQDDEAPRRFQWRLWREQDRILTENLAAGTAELWQRDGQAIFHHRIFHADHHSIEYRNDDLIVTNTAVNWPQRMTLIDPALLSQLTLKRSGWRDGVPYQRYVGEYADASWDITVRPDLMLPLKMVRIHDGLREETTLQQTLSLNDAPAPTPFDDYQVIDFADIGDRHDDPFVRKVQSQLGAPPHLH